MKAERIIDRRIVLRPDMFQEVVISLVPERVRGCEHDYKYRLALVHEGRCVLRYDNEAGKGDHRHLGDKEEPYAFASIDQLLADFDQSTEEYWHGYADYR